MSSRKWVAVLVGLVCFSASVDFACAYGLARGGTGSVAQVIPNLVAGAFAPTAQTPAMPSASTWDPSCLDATWGTGCNVATHTCIAPTSGTPLETCQPPQEFVVTGGSGNGTSATINYTSYAHYTFSATTPMIVSGATQTNWSTPVIEVNGFSSTSGPNTVTLGCLTSCANLVVGKTIYVGQVTGTGPTSAPGFGWTQIQNISGTTTSPISSVNALVGGTGGTPGSYPAFALTGGTGTGATANITVSAGGVVTVATLVGAGQGYTVGDVLSGSPGGVSGFSVHVASLVAANYTNVPITGGSGTGGVVTVTVNNTGAISNVVFSAPGVGYQTGDSIGLNTAGIPGLAGLSGFAATLVFTTPNGLWTVQSVASSGCPGSASTCVTFSTGATQVQGTLSALNDLNFNGTIQQPFAVTSSVCNIGGVPEHCSVTFPNTFTCSSACVGASTQIVAGQNDDVIMAWNYGEDVQNSVQNGDVMVCSMAKHISPIQFVKFTLDGGPLASAPTSIVNPWGPGKSTLSEPTTNYSYCAHFSASAVSDGLHEIRAIACPTVGYCGQLSSVITADGAPGSTYFTSNNHALPAWKNIGITNSFDPAFQNYNWQYYSAGISVTSGSGGGSGSFNLGFTQPTNYPLFQPGQTVNVAGTSTGTSCPITGAVSDGANLTLTYSGGCSFPTGSSVNLAGVTIAPVSILSGTYNSGSGIISLTFSSAPWGASPATGTDIQHYLHQYWLTLTGTGLVSSLNGEHQLISSSAGGTVLNFQDSTGITATISGGTVSGTGGTATTPLAWNTDTRYGVTVSGNPSGGVITIPSILTSVWSAGGTITSNWNGNCTIPASYTPTSGSISCPTLNAANSWVSGGTITATGNVYCPVGGAGDWFPPYDPAAVAGAGPRLGQLTPGSFQLIPLAPNSCITVNADQNVSGCTYSPCGITPTQAETLWFTRKDSGVDERYNSQVTMNVNGSLWITTNAGRAIQAQNAYTNSWKQTAGGLGCQGPVIPAGTSVPYTGNYCSDMKSAFYGLAPTANGLTQTLANSGSCLTFTQAQNQGSTPFYVGEPVEWTGLDKNANPALSMWGVYWVQSLTGTAPSGAITLAATPTGACINDTAANITTSALFKDVGMDSLLLACDTTATVPCSSANPETFLVGTSNVLTAPTLYAKSGYLNISPDTNPGSTFPATSHQVSLLNGAGGIAFGSGTAQGGRIRVTADSIETQLSLTTVVPISKTPPITTVANGTATGTTETLNFATLSGVAWQVAGTGSPGQGIIVSGVSPADGNCGTAAIPCHITSATSTSITFTNPGATSTTYTAGGKIVPASIILQLAPGTFAYNAANVPPSGCASNSVSVNTGSAIACLAQYGASRTASGTNSTAWPFYSSAGGQITNLALSSNCLPIGTAQQPGQVFITTPLNIIPGAISGGNDILELTWGGVAGQNVSFQAYNNCGTGPFFFANTGAVLSGFATHVATDVWEDGRDITGPYWANAFLGAQGSLNGGLTGASYLTNSHRYNTHSASDRTSYVWGSNSEYNTGICINGTNVSVDNRCIGSQEAVPFSLGGGNTTGIVYGAFWIPLTANVTSGDKVFSVAQGALPANFTPGWGGYIICNFANPLTASSASITSTAGVVITAYDNSTSPSTVTFASAATSSCTTGQNPVLLLYNIIHIDMLFYTLNAAAPPMIGGGQWDYYTNNIIENLACPGCVNMQGIFMGGGNYYDMAFDDDDIEVWGNPVPSQQFSITSFTPLTPYLMQNWVVRNTNLWGRIAFPNDPSTIEQTFSDVFTINDSGGVSQLGFPLIVQFNSLYGGFGGMSNGQHLAIGGSEQATVWPTLTRTVDGAGVPTGGGTPWSGSLSACPWVGGILGCAAGDPGNGSL